MPNNITTPSFLVASSGLDIVGFNLQDVGPTAVQAGYVTFGQVFAEGALKPTNSLTSTINGTRQAVQVDAKTFYADGSVQMAVLTVAHDQISAGTTAEGMLSQVSQVSRDHPADFMTIIGGASAITDLHFSDGSDFVLDLFDAARSSLSDGSAKVWLSGANATQINFSTAVRGSLRLVTTITAYADGTYSTNVSFNNDIAMGPSGGDYSYSVKITQNQQQVVSIPMVHQYQYQDWTTSFSSGNSVPLNVQHDPKYLEAIKAIPVYDLRNGVASSVILDEHQALLQPDFGSPLSANAVTQQMPTTGGRGDIGPTTQANAAWLVSQDPTAASFALGQADASGAVPWNMWDASRNEYVNSQTAPDIWTANSGGPGSYTTGLTQKVDNNCGWMPETAHQPDLSYYAFLMTGSNSYLQSLNAQASWDITATWQPTRGAQQLVVNQQQVRASAWNLRDVDEASYANPDGSAAKAYFTNIATANWQWLVAQIPTWTILQGAAYGQVEGDYAPGRIGPWQQDYFASTAIQAAEHGNVDALTFLKWESNFLVGRFLQPDFSPRDAIAYNLKVGPNDGTRLQSWGAIEEATITSGMSNGSGWSQSNGDYGELALATLSGIISLTGSSDAIKAYNYLLTSGAPFTDSASRARDVQFDMAPRLPAGFSFASDGTIVASEQPRVLVIVGPPPAPTLLNAFHGESNRTDPSIAGTAIAGDTVTVIDSSSGASITIGATMADVSGNWTMHLTGVSDGPHSYTVTDTSPDGATSLPSKAVSFTVDTTAPSAPTITSSSITRLSSSTIQGTGEAGSSIAVVDGNAIIAATVAGEDGRWSVSSANLADGDHRVIAIATDLAGNQSNASTVLSLTVDTIAPVAPGTPTLGTTDPLTTDTAITIEGSGAEPFGVIKLSDATVAVALTQVDALGNWATTVELGAGDHTLSAMETDAAGNASGQSRALEFTVSQSSKPETVNVVYRFFDAEHGTQFLTSSVSERDTIIATRPDLKFEGKAMGSVDADPSSPNVTSVFRFFDTSNGTHFFTTSAGERDGILADRHDLVLEQAKLFEHSRQQAGDTAVYRFFNTNDGSHFFTSEASEYASITQNRHDMIAEGVSFYAPRV